ncbi:hypothetical protein SAMN06269185_1641 [Natronoarchaeum philippinense]|uniref:Uncharacterized protein n=1 Tax=Natronoarchaeum philippinense TaxID=558529 RepID=A0A285NSA3_NATPI|nr:hypothetical protein [Natronoarchaeum philippinense]SNZ12349.1 hypothetical protein SAMN06269185_1641 [Natronoarchaeum philippinense]
MSEKSKTDRARECIPVLRDVLEEVLEEGDSGRGPPLSASIDAAHALEGLDRAEDSLEAWDGWDRGRHISGSSGHPQDMPDDDNLDHDHDLGLTLEILRRNLFEYENADDEMERKKSMQNYLASVNTLVAHSHHLAREELDEEMEWLTEQKRQELRELLDEIEGE